MQNTDDFTKDTDGFDTAYKKMMQTHVNFITWGTERGSYSKIFCDPDAWSKTLYQRHEKAWHGKYLQDLTFDQKNNYHLTCKNLPDVNFSSDTIFTDFTSYDDQKTCPAIFKQLVTNSTNYLTNMECYLKECYQNIGGFIIFPKMGGSINQARGGKQLCDRFDLALDCIRRYFKHRDPQDATPLQTTFAKAENIAFFNLFKDFQEYVNFFCLQDLVNGDYTRVVNLMGTTTWVSEQTFANPLPQSVDEYQRWMRNQLDFIRRRTDRINARLV